MSKRVSVEVSDKVWWLLSERAELAEVTVPTVIARMATAFTEATLPPEPRQPNRPDTLLAQVVHLHAAGYTDVRIAEVLGCHDQTVADKRRTLGLEANGRKQG